MPFQRGEDVNIGFGLEDPEARGVGVGPAIWIPGRTPTGIKPVIDKVLVKETRASKVGTTASEIVQKRAEGSLEFNARVISIGYVLKSLMGSLVSAPKDGDAGVYQHTLGLLAQDPQHPTLTLALSQPEVQDYEHANAVVKSVKIRVVPNDLVTVTIEHTSKIGAEHSEYSVSFPSNDLYFRAHDVSLKMAAGLADLGAAGVTKFKELELVLVNNARPDQNVGDGTGIGDVIAAGIFQISGTLKLDYLDKTLHDIVVAGDYRAMRLELKRDDVTIGTSSKPMVRLDLARASFEDWDPERPLEDVMRQGLKFVGHYSPSDAKAIQGLIENTQAAYVHEDES